MREFSEIPALMKAGYNVEELTNRQFRVESVVDLYPRGQRFHNIRTQERGNYTVKGLLQFIAAQLDQASNVARPTKGRWHDPADAPWWTKVESK